ncbi:MAG: tRNA pseudouridine(38-40) synthase TruA [Verrucomicrobiota bacterium]
MSPIKIKLTIAYDGTRYEGWQVQKTGVGVQQVIEQALSQFLPNSPRLHSSSRTDAGVHALGMVAHLELAPGDFKSPISKLPLAINAHLPEDIRILSAKQCAAAFHARFDATGKQYRYFIWNHPAQNPLLRLQAWHVPRRLDLPAMNAAAKLLLGTHDFASFAATRDYEMKSTVRTVQRCDLRKSGSLLTFTVEGDGFLYKMCRGIVGTLVQVGLGKLPVGRIPAILRSKDRRAAGMSAPAHGLVLWRVFYSQPKPGSVCARSSKANAHRPA